MLAHFKDKAVGCIASDGDNKMELIRFLVNRWRTNSSVQVSIPLYIANEDKCICINATGSHFATELESNQEEADTRMLLHAKHASQTINNIIIHTPDIDFLLIALAASTELKSNLFIRTGTTPKSRLISMNKIKSSMGSLYDLDDISMTVKAILRFHAFTGCDTVSAFCGKRKIKSLKILLKNCKYIMTFSGIGLTTDLTEEQLDVLQEFVCDIYGHKGTSTNDLRFKLYCSK